MKVVNTSTLKKMVANARLKMFNRLLNKEVEQKLDPHGLHVLSHDFMHGDGECIRCGVVLLKIVDQEEPLVGVLDFSIEDWNDIPEYKKGSQP